MAMRVVAYGITSFETRFPPSIERGAIEPRSTLPRRSGTSFHKRASDGERACAGSRNALVIGYRRSLACAATRWTEFPCPVAGPRRWSWSLEQSKGPRDGEGIARDQARMARVAAGDESAFAAIVADETPRLLRFAVSILGSGQAEAEEVVQEALVAALESLPDFRGDSSLRTWLTSILRFKIADHQRRAVRDRQVFESPPEDTEDEEAWLDAQFDETGHWRESPKAWFDPASSLEQRRFWEVFERCLGRLPAQGGRVFFQREVIGEETKAICEAEGITENNCWVLLHRARNALRACLEANWFGAGGAHDR